MKSKRTVLKFIGYETTLIVALVVGWHFSTRETSIVVFTDPSERAALVTSENADLTRGRILVFVADWCPACKSLEHDLTSYKVPFVRLDIEANSKAAAVFERLAATTGSRGIPKIIFDNELVGRGELFRRIALQNSSDPSSGS